MKNQGKVLSFWLEPWDWGAFSERIRFGGGAHVLCPGQLRVSLPVFHYRSPKEKD